MRDLFLLISPSMGQNGIVGYGIIKECFELKGYGIEEAHIDLQSQLKKRCVHD